MNSFEIVFAIIIGILAFAGAIYLILDVQLENIAVSESSVTIYFKKKEPRIFLYEHTQVVFYLTVRYGVKVQSRLHLIGVRGIELLMTAALSLLIGFSMSSELVKQVVVLESYYLGMATLIAIGLFTIVAYRLLRQEVNKIVVEKAGVTIYFKRKAYEFFSYENSKIQLFLVRRGRNGYQRLIIRGNTRYLVVESLGKKRFKLNLDKSYSKVTINSLMDELNQRTTVNVRRE